MLRVIRCHWGRMDIPGGETVQAAGCRDRADKRKTDCSGGLGPTGEPPCLLPSRLRGFFASYVTTSNTSLVAACSSQHQAQNSVSGECSASGFLKVLVYCALSLWDQSLIKRSKRL